MNELRGNIIIKLDKGLQTEYDLLGLRPDKTTDAKTVVLIVVVGRVEVRGVEVQVVRVVVAVRRPTPVVAVRATIVRGRTVEVAGVEEQEDKL